MTTKDQIRLAELYVENFTAEARGLELAAAKVTQVVDSLPELLEAL